MTAPWNGRPPAPLDQVDGALWLLSVDGLGPFCAIWKVQFEDWSDLLDDMSWEPPTAAARFTYVAPVLTPNQIATQIAEAVKAEREACAEVCDAETLHAVGCNPQMVTGRLAAAIRARGETA